MKIKIYKKDWFYNAGIIGFLRILEHNQDQFAQIKENYIEFESESLKKFAKYYFQYFFDTYNVALKTEKKIKKSFTNITNYLNIEETDKITQEKIKSEKKYIKLVIKSQLDKIKKIDEEIYQEMLEEYNQIDEIKIKEDIEKIEGIQQKLTENLYLDKINKRLTINLFKSILSKNYFGQPSFLNVVKSSLSYEEQENLMYLDYISNIVETGFLQEIVEEKYSVDQLKIILEEKQKDPLIKKEIQKIEQNILKKYIDKNKEIKEIQNYLKENVLTDCHMCENENCLTSNYSESNFIPLAISSDNMKNFFWNQNAKFPICDLCKLILFCIPAGITNLTKTIKEYQQGQIVYKEKEIVSFVNDDSNIESLFKINNYLKDRARTNENMQNPYNELILNIVTQEKQLSEWQLQNIFVVEFETEYLAYSRMEYFHIKKYVARFFKEYAQTSLNHLKDYRFKLQIMDFILKDKDLKYIINERLREELRKENPFGLNCFLATKTRMTLNLLKKEDKNMEEKIKENNKKISVLYNIGTEIHEKLKNDKQENKLSGYSYKIINSIKAGNKKEFMDSIIRIHMAMEKDVSPIFLEVMKESDLDLETIGSSFIAGLVSNKYEKKEEVTENEQ